MIKYETQQLQNDQNFSFKFILIQLAQMKIRLALVQKQLAFWTQLAY